MHKQKEVPLGQIIYKITITNVGKNRKNKVLKEKFENNNLSN